MTTKTKPCRDCSTPTDYEPFAILDREFSLPVLCASCEAKQADREAEEAAKRAVREEEERQLAIETKVRRIIPPDLYRTDPCHAGFNRGLWKAIESWHPSQNRWLVIVGETGLSKSRVCALHAMKLLREGCKVMWITAGDFQRAVLQQFSDDRAEKAEARQVLKDCRETDVLVFDDFGKGKFTESVESHLFDLIDHRKNWDKVMMISANTHPQQMLALGMFSRDRGAPIVGRIVEAAHQNIYNLRAQAA
jgi:DNA replication protein DnaC